MNKSQIATWERLQRIGVFFDVNANAYPSISMGRARVELDDVLNAIPQAAGTHEAATNEARCHTKRLRELRKDLRICHLAPIITIARVKTPHTAFASALRLPRQGTPDHELIAVATDIATAVVDYRRLFLQQQFPDDFVEQLVAAADALRRAGQAAERSRDESVSATREIGALFRRGRELARLLGTLVLSRRPHDPALAATWQYANASRHARPSQSARSTA
jgi:hypothetical protein